MSSPGSIPGLDPLKERKLEERLYPRVPGVKSQVGFDSDDSLDRFIKKSPSIETNTEEEEEEEGEEEVEEEVNNNNNNNNLKRNLEEEEIVEEEGKSKRQQFSPRAQDIENTSNVKSLSHHKSSSFDESLLLSKKQPPSILDNFGVSKSDNNGTPTAYRSSSSPTKFEIADDTLRVEDDGDEDEDDEEFQRLVGGGAVSHSPHKSASPLPINKKGRYTKEEDDCLLAKQAEFGSNWKLVSQHAGEILAGRTPAALSRRFNHLTKKKKETGTVVMNSTVPNTVSTIDGVNEGDDDEVQILEPQRTASNPERTGGGVQAQITNFFKVSGGSTSSNGAPSSQLSTSTRQMVTTSSSSLTSNGNRTTSPPAMSLQHASMIGQLNQQVANLKEENSRLTLELEKARRQKQEAEDSLAQKEREYEKTFQDLKQRNSRASELMQEVLRAADEEEGAKIRKNLAAASYFLGKVSIQRPTVANAQMKEVWDDGVTKKELNIKGTLLLQAKTELEKTKTKRKEIKRTNSSAASSSTSTSTTSQALEMELEDRAFEETRQLKIAKIKQDEALLAEERNKYQIEKALHMRELKRVRDEDMSRFSNRPVLMNRYLFRSILGKGGFSEVWKAFDLQEMRDVAIKVHELDPSWSEERRKNYAKHAKREYEIHLALRHPRIVQLYDVIEINQSSSFATVLEYCSGTDLDVHLKKHKVLPEKEARSILMQILSGLLCLSTGGGLKDSTSIIHFDVKPANILFDGEGGVKITDFGLSKIVTDHPDDTIPGVELTSQGAGTYWYLPPECFNFDRRNPPKISSKVDVWSTGVVFYQMLFGQRPFGEGQSQESILKDETVLRATKVEFPTKPIVSDMAKDFIRRCLTHNQQLRPDVETICQDPYLKPPKKKSTSTISTTITATATSSSFDANMMAI